MSHTNPATAHCGENQESKPAERSSRSPEKSQPRRWRHKSEGSPAADGRRRETLVTEQSTLTGRLVCTPGAPTSLSPGRPGPTSARESSFMVSVPGLRGVHTHTLRGTQPQPCSCLGLSRSSFCVPLSSYFTPDAQHSPGFSLVPTTHMCL